MTREAEDAWEANTMGWLDNLSNMAAGAIGATPIGAMALGAVKGATKRTTPAGAPRRAARRRRGIPKSIMADVLALKGALGPKAAETTLHILLRR